MRVAGLLFCLLAAAAAVYPESPVKGSAARITALPSVQPGDVETPLLTEETVAAWISKWQQRLGLQDWKIQSSIVRLSKLQKGTVANIHWSLPRKTATIKVLHPLDSTVPPGEIVRDTELSVVHELVHLSLAKLPLDGNDTDVEEETVKRLSTALLALEKQDEDGNR